MEIRFKQTAAAFFCLILAALLYCPAADANDGAYYPIRVENPDGLRLFFVRSDIKDGDLVVSGSVRRSRLPGRVASAVNVSITGFDGKLIAERSVKYTPRVLARHKAHDEARFYTRFDSIPERGVLIHVGRKKTAEKN
ncbi:MAG: hypothetical protein ACQETG_02025 [Thermodesulfobacteriota bacterium]